MRVVQVLEAVEEVATAALVLVDVAAYAGALRAAMEAIVATDTQMAAVVVTRPLFLMVKTSTSPLSVFSNVS